MNKKTLAIIGVITVLLIGIVSAGLLDYFGRISESVTVEGPVFYLDGNLEEAYYNLFINEIPSDEKEVNLTNGNRLLFITEPLGVEYFYEANFSMKVWMKTNNESNIAQYRVLRVKDNLLVSNICPPEDGVIYFDGHYNSFWKKEFSCQSNGKIQLNPGDRIGLEISGAGGTSKYWISTGKKYTKGYSRIEVSAA